jgi:hypothetical protein
VSQLSIPLVEREKIHRRTIVIDGYRRADGLWDIEGEIQDVKSIDHVLKTHVHPANVPVHGMKLRITVDNTLTIRNAEAVTLTAPYNPECQSVAPVYAKLKGLQIKAGFRGEVAKIVGGTKGCTHITELIGNLATGAVQTTAGLIPVAEGSRPVQVGGCYAIREDGPLVREFFPQWYRSPDKN